jgi:manganese/zinc/iron transport system ATP- binding protein
MTAMLGPNGAGKSTLMKAALGIVRPLAGEARFYGRPLAEARDRIAYVPQRASVDWDFPTRARDVVTMGLYRELGLLGRLTRAHRARAEDCLARVGMADFADRQIGQLSGGQQQRVFLARALAQNADLYLLDEPFAGVDAATEKAIIAVLKDLKGAGQDARGGASRPVHGAGLLRPRADPERPPHRGGRHRGGLHDRRASGGLRRPARGGAARPAGSRLRCSSTR